MLYSSINEKSWYEIKDSVSTFLFKVKKNVINKGNVKKIVIVVLQINRPLWFTDEFKRRTKYIGIFGDCWWVIDNIWLIKNMGEKKAIIIDMYIKCARKWKVWICTRFGLLGDFQWSYLNEFVFSATAASALFNFIRYKMFY